MPLLTAGFVVQAVHLMVAAKYPSVSQFSAAVPGHFAAERKSPSEFGKSESRFALAVWRFPQSGKHFAPSVAAMRERRTRRAEQVEAQARMRADLVADTQTGFEVARED